MAHKKAGGSTSLGRESQSKRLGVKMTAGQLAKPGSILVRQRGIKIHPGKKIKKGKDDTLYSVATGKVKFLTKKMLKFDRKLKVSKVVSVVPEKA